MASKIDREQLLPIVLERRAAATRKRTGSGCTTSLVFSHSVRTLVRIGFRECPDNSRTANNMDWKLWFVQFSGWPAFLSTTAVVLLFALCLPRVMTWISNRSVIQSAMLTVLALTILVMAAVGLLVFLSRW